MDTYEVAVMYHPDLEIDLAKGTTKIKAIISDAGGEITQEDEWGKRKLAYPIAGNEHAIYVFYRVNMKSSALAEIERTFNITDEIVRFLITKVDEKAIAKAKTASSERKRTNEGKQDEDEGDK